MDGQVVLGWVLIGVGFADVVMARVLGARLGLPAKVRTVLSYMGVALILIGSTLVTRKVAIF